MKFEFNDILGLKEPTTKLIEVVSELISTVYEPRKIKKLTSTTQELISNLWDFL